MQKRAPHPRRVEAPLTEGFHHLPPPEDDAPRPPTGGPPRALVEALATLVLVELERCDRGRPS